MFVCVCIDFNSMFSLFVELIPDVKEHFWSELRIFQRAKYTKPYNYYPQLFCFVFVGIIIRVLSRTESKADEKV